MRPNVVVRERLRLEAMIKKYEDKLEALQEKCQHPDVVKRHKSDTGNWDRGQDCYWMEFSCPDCDKFWTVEGSV
jgi:hypothetical protein